MGRAACGRSLLAGYVMVVVALLCGVFFFVEKIVVSVGFLLAWPVEEWMMVEAISSR